jgi:hypothetical protein
MERRRVQRIKRRLPCEFLHQGNRHRGIVVDFSPGGLFLQTDTSLDPGSEVEVHLSGHLFPEISLRAVVARRRFTPAVLATMIRRGVGLRLVDAPPEYHEALRRLGRERSDEGAGDAVAIEIEVSEQVELSEPPEPQVLAPPVEPAALESEPALPAPAVLEEAPADEPAKDQEGWIFEPDLPSDALMIDDGELDDVHALLVELGANPAREHANAAAFRGWAVPPRLLVVSAGCAARLRVPSQAAADGVVTVAVAEADSLTLRSMLRRQGFHYVVRRPVHPEALRLLLMRALYREAERRSVVRLAFGYEVSWRAGWGRRQGLLTEISSGGCRMLCGEAPEPGTRLTLRIPREVADGRALSLPGRVLRCERRTGASADTRHAFAFRFEDLSARARERLEVILQERHTGPATLPGRVRQEASEARPPRRLRLRLAVPPREREAKTPHRERRRSARGLLAQEVLALDSHAERVKHVLYGRDLSVGGLRIEPHPELALGDRIRLAIYEPSSLEAILLEGTVQRDDKEHGLVLSFDDVTPEARGRLEGMISELPSVETEGPEGQPAKALVISEIVSE